MLATDAYNRCLQPLRLSIHFVELSSLLSYIYSSCDERDIRRCHLHRRGLSIRKGQIVYPCRTYDVGQLFVRAVPGVKSKKEAGTISNEWYGSYYSLVKVVHLLLIFRCISEFSKAIFSYLPEK